MTYHDLGFDLRNEITGLFYKGGIRAGFHPCFYAHSTRGNMSAYADGCPACFYFYLKLSMIFAGKCVIVTNVEYKIY